jgi:hypothetical protein
MWHLVVWDFDSIYCKKIKFLITNFSLEIAKKCWNVHVWISTQPHRQQLKTHTHTHAIHIQKVQSNISRLLFQEMPNVFFKNEWWGQLKWFVKKKLKKF